MSRRGDVRGIDTSKFDKIPNPAAGNSKKRQPEARNRRTPEPEALPSTVPPLLRPTSMYKDSPMHVQRQPAAFNANNKERKRLEIKECKDTYEKMLAAASLALFVDERPRAASSGRSTSSTAAAPRHGAVEKVRSSGGLSRKVTFADGEAPDAADAPAPPAVPIPANAIAAAENIGEANVVLVPAQPPKASVWTVEVNSGSGSGRRGPPFSHPPLTTADNTPAPAPALIPALAPAPPSAIAPPPPA